MGDCPIWQRVLCEKDFGFAKVMLQQFVLLFNTEKVHSR
jgi:hypothetical protein